MATDAMVLTSNIALSGRDEFFMRGDTFLRALDGLFDKESGLVMRNPNTAAGGLDPRSVEVVPQATKVGGLVQGGVGKHRESHR